MSPPEIATWREVFDDIHQQAAALTKVGLMKLRPSPGVHRYAVAVEDNGLWLALWVQRSKKGEFFVFQPRGDFNKIGDQQWLPHTSYHLDGTLHMKAHDRVMVSNTVQPPTQFRGTLSLGCYAGFAPKAVGAVCDPAAFAGVVRIEPGTLGPRHGAIAVDLVESCQPEGSGWSADWSGAVVRHTFRDIDPCVIITVGTPRG